MKHYYHYYLCERCGGTGRQPAGCWNGQAYASQAGACDDCMGDGYLGRAWIEATKTKPPIGEQVAFKCEIDGDFTCVDVGRWNGKFSDDGRALVMICEDPTDWCPCTHWRKIGTLDDQT